MAPLWVEFAGLCVMGWALGYGSIAALGADGAGTRATFAVPVAVVCSLVWPWSRAHLWEPGEHTLSWILLTLVCVALAGWCSRDTAAPRYSM